MLNCQVLFFTTDLSITDIEGVPRSNGKFGHVFHQGPHAYTNATHDFETLKNRGEHNIFWFFSDSDKEGFAFTTWKTHIANQRIVEYNKPKKKPAVITNDLEEIMEEILSEAPSLSENFIIFDTDVWPAVGLASQYPRVAFGHIWKESTEVDGLLYHHSQPKFYLKVQGTNQYQYITPEKLNQLGYDYSHLYESQQTEAVTSDE